jgi:hypothetical protein
MMRVGKNEGGVYAIRRDSHGTYFIYHYQGVSRAKWPKDSDDYASIQTGSAICRPLKVADIEYRPPRDERLSKRAKKL